ncbi:MAG: CsbD family protein [Burkholderiales bacterium]|nr:CsbD family protein [Burkholderiales bacterium]
MNWDQVEGNWKVLKGKVRESWGKLTDDHVDRIAGKRQQLSGEIQKAYGVGKEEAEKQIDAFQSRCETERWLDATDKKKGTLQ